jgi:hypothetical protein
VKTSRKNALVQPLPFAVLVFPYPPVKLTAIVVMDCVSEDTIELPIRSREDMQEQVVGPKLICCPRHARNVGAWTNIEGFLPSLLTAFPGGTITRASVSPMSVGVVCCTGAFGAASRPSDPSY